MWSEVRVRKSGGRIRRKRLGEWGRDRQRQGEGGPEKSERITKLAIGNPGFRAVVVVRACVRAWAWMRWWGGCVGVWRWSLAMVGARQAIGGDEVVSSGAAWDEGHVGADGTLTRGIVMAVGRWCLAVEKWSGGCGKAIHGAR